MNNVVNVIEQQAIIPVAKINKVESAVPLISALIQGGLSCVEITFRSEAARDSIEIIRDNFPEFLIGAGTILSVDQIELARSAGAHFYVSPGLDEDIIKHCMKQNLLYIPGVITPYEIQKALIYEITIMKFFPAENYGGVKAIHTLSGPFPNVKFFPSGGINEKNIMDYLSLPNVIACGGSWLVDSDLIDNGKFSEIERITKKIVHKINVLRTKKLLSDSNVYN